MAWSVRRNSVSLGGGQTSQELGSGRSYSETDGYVGVVRWDVRLEVELDGLTWCDVLTEIAGRIVDLGEAFVHVRHDVQLLAGGNQLNGPDLPPSGLLDASQPRAVVAARYLWSWQPPGACEGFGRGARLMLCHFV